MKTSEILRVAKALIENPEHWVQGTYARPNRESKEHIMGDDPEAVCWCSIGAIQKVTAPIAASTWEAEKLLNKAAREIANYDFTGATSFNDSHTHAEVMTMWERAIAMAEDQENL